MKYASSATMIALTLSLMSSNLLLTNNAFAANNIQRINSQRPQLNLKQRSVNPSKALPTQEQVNEFAAYCDSWGGGVSTEPDGEGITMVCRGSDGNGIVGQGPYLPD